jgi:hypothetical protein
MEELKINNKNIYIVENHQEILEAWALLRNQLREPPLLFSLDHHCDTREAFVQYICKIYKEFKREKKEELIRKISYTNLKTVHKAIRLLNKDEHIDAAINTDIIKGAFIFQYDNNDITPPSFKS